MAMDFIQPPPPVQTLEKAQELINGLWNICDALSKRMDLQQTQIKAQQNQIDDLLKQKPETLPLLAEFLVLKNKRLFKSAPIIKNPNSHHVSEDIVSR